MIKLSLSTPVPPEEQAAVDAWLDTMAQMLEAEIQQQIANAIVYGCSRPEFFADLAAAWPPKLLPLVTDS